MENFKIDIDADGIATVAFDVPGRSMNTLTSAVIAEGWAGPLAVVQKDVRRTPPKLFSKDTLARAWERGINPADALQDNDGHGFFQALDASVITGPTHTNVNDFRAILILETAKHDA